MWRQVLQLAEPFLHPCGGVKENDGMRRQALSMFSPAMHGKKKSDVFSSVPYFTR